jgi:hypothetical protein
MEVQLRDLLGRELRRRHGIGMMEGKIKPVHIANALMRVEHQSVGRMSDLKNLMSATASKETAEQRLEAARVMLERSKERWGRLGEETDLRKSLLMTRVLPLLRTILATDGAAFGTSPEWSSFSSPTALTVTRDVSDDHAGEFVHQLWTADEASGSRELLRLLREATDPNKELRSVDDLTAILAPLTDDTTPIKQAEWSAVDLSDDANESEVAANLRSAAADLARYEAGLKPNPIATLQRVVLLASMSVFFHASACASEWGGLPSRFLLVDASGSRHSAIASASQQLVMRLLADARDYMARVLAEILDTADKNWVDDPEAAISELLDRSSRGETSARGSKILLDLIDEIQDTDGSLRDELPRRLIELIDSSSGRSLDGFLRLLGVRAGLLYPQQKNPTKRLAPTDRTLEVLVASTFDITRDQLEYRDFLDALFKRWRIIVGGRLEDAKLLDDAKTPVSTGDLSENSERFLSRLQTLGLARKLADSVAVVGLMEGHNGGN